MRKELVMLTSIFVSGCGFLENTLLEKSYKETQKQAFIHCSNNNGDEMMPAGLTSYYNLITINKIYVYKCIDFKENKTLFIYKIVQMDENTYKLVIR